MRVFKIILTLFLLGIVTQSKAQFEERFYFPKKEWREVKIPYSEEFIPVENDTIHTVFFQPKSTPKATVLFFHGAGGNISTYMYMIEPLVVNNYQVYAVDFRGYGKSSGKSTHKNITEDAEVIFNRMKENKLIKNSKLLVYGASLGCQIATHFTKKHQNEVDALILDGGFSSFADVAKLYAPKNVHEYIVTIFSKLYSSKEDVKEIVNLPKLIIHGKKDKSIPMSHSKLVYKNAQEPKRFFVSEVGHLDAIKIETEKVLIEIDKLLTVRH